MIAGMTNPGNRDPLAFIGRRVPIMKPAPLVLLIALLAAPAAAQSSAAGHWVINGSVQGDDFVIHCDFRQSGTNLTGTCHDFTPDGKAHPLTSGRVEDGRIRFVYKSNWLLVRFDAVYEGTITGDTMRGKASAAGREGTFTGRRTS